MAFNKVHEKSSTCPCTMRSWNGQNETHTFMLDLNGLRVTAMSSTKCDCFAVWHPCLHLLVTDWISVCQQLKSTLCSSTEQSYTVIITHTSTNYTNILPIGAACSVQAEHFICWLCLSCIRAARWGPLKWARLIQLRNFILIFKTCRCCNLYIWE